MYVRNLKTENRELQEVITDIYFTTRYFEVLPLSSMYVLSRLPLLKGYGEHPYWLIEKLEFILSIFNKTIKEVKG